MSKLTLINPATEETFGELEEDSDFEIEEKIKKARESREWREKTAGERAEIILRFADLLEESREELAIIMANEIGKPLKAGRHEVEIAKKRLIDFCNMIPKFLEDEILFEDNKEKNIVKCEPLGIAAVISPWNAPIFVSLAGIIPQLLCGNNVIWKPSEYSSFTGLKLSNLLLILLA